jgi:hypothetical protein
MGLANFGRRDAEDDYGSGTKKVKAVGTDYTSRLKRTQSEADWERAFLAALTGTGAVLDTPASDLVEHASNVADEAVKVMAKRRSE